MQAAYPACLAPTGPEFDYFAATTTAMRTFALALAAFTVLSANSCKQKAPDAAQLLEKKWVFQTLNGLRLELPEGAETPWLKLTGDRLQGFGGCNALMAGYTLAGDKLSFSDIGSTKKYCEGIQPTENAVKDVLKQTDSFRFDDGAVRLMAAGKELATLRGE